MNKDIDPGGPAFPTAFDAQGYQGCGMTLRDYFAAKAMHAELMTCGVHVALHMALNAYEMADAMLKAREQ